jgi:acetylornithine deacetylase
MTRPTPPAPEQAPLPAPEQAVELLCELVGIDSVNPGLVEGAEGEAVIVDRLRARLERSGFATTVVVPDASPDRPSLVAVGPGPREAPTVILNGHLDTVGVAGMADPFTPRIEGNRLMARGAADMKGGVAGLVVAAEHLAGAAHVRPVLALVADEEDASLGSEAVIAALPDLGVRPVACLVAEPTGLELCRTLRGFGVVDVTFAGQAAHSSQPQLGVNAVTHLGRLLRAVDERAEVVRGHGGDLMVTVVRGGSSPFVIPDSAQCTVELRTAPEGRGAGALDEVEALLLPEWAARAELVGARDGWRLDSCGPAAELAALLGAELGTGPTFEAPYWMEAPLWQAVCPTLICGPTGGGLHAVDEWVDLDQVRAFTAALLRVLSAWAPDAD